MFVAAAIVSALLAVTLVNSARMKLTRNEPVIDVMTRVKFPLDKLWLLAVAEVAGAVGLIVGLFWWPIGVAAAAGVVLYFVGAVIYHLRAHDMTLAPAAVLVLVSIAALVLRAVTV